MVSPLKPSSKTKSLARRDGSDRSDNNRHLDDGSTGGGGGGDDDDDDGSRRSVEIDANHECDGADDYDAGAKLDPADGGKNLDSGYAWLILLVMFLIQSSISGTSRAYGIVYAKEVSIGYYDREEASWPIATASAVENLASILMPAVTSYLSWRQIEVLSASLFIASNLMAYFSSSLALDIVALGLVQGLALSSSSVLSMVINNDYFERYRTTAYGIQMSGSTFGVLYLSPLVSWLLTEFDNFRLVYLALAVVFCANVFLVLFIKPRAQTIKSTAKQQQPGLGSQKSNLANLKGLAAEGQVHGQLDRKQSQTQEPAVSKQSLLVSHFERKSSIASISDRAHSRRQSVLSRSRLGSVAISDIKCARREHSSNSIYTIDQQPSGAGRRPSSNREQKRGSIMESKSGITLASQLDGLTACYFDIDGCTGPPKEHELGLVDQMGSKGAGPNGARGPLEPDQAASRDAPDKLPAEQRVVSKLSEAILHPRQTTTTTTTHSPGAVALQANGRDQHGHDDNACSWRLDAADLESGTAAAGAGRNNNLSWQRDAEKCYGGCCLDGLDKAHLDKLDKLGGQGGEEQEFEAPGEIRLTMKQTLVYLRLPYLHCTWMMLALYFLVARIFVIILVDFADDHGFTLQESTNLLNYWAMGELLGRVFLGSLIDLQYLSCKNCIAFTCALLSGAILLMVLVESYVLYAACATCIAALISLEYMLINVLMVEYLGKEHVTNCYSLAACLCSTILFLRPSLIGFFRDHLGTYDGLLIMLASITSLFALGFYIFEPIFVRKWPKRQVNLHPIG